MNSEKGEILMWRKSLIDYVVCEMQCVFNVSFFSSWIDVIDGVARCVMFLLTLCLQDIFTNMLVDEEGRLSPVPSNKLTAFIWKRGYPRRDASPLKQVLVLCIY